MAINVGGLVPASTKAKNEAITPILDGICETREVTKEWLVYKVIEKADKYISSIGKIIGKRQKAEKEITNAN